MVQTLQQPFFKYLFPSLVLLEGYFDSFLLQLAENTVHSNTRAFYFYFQPDREFPPTEEPYSKNPAFPVPWILYLLASLKLIWAHHGPRL